MIRDATPDDLPAINDLYNTTIVDSHVSFDAEPWTLEARRQWWEAREADLVCLVAEEGGAVVGVAYSSRWRPKVAYRSTAETTIVVGSAHQERGVGSELLEALTDRLATAGVHRAVAIIALPNEASVGLHRKLGYRKVGVLTEAGHKLGRYWDTMILEKPLS